MLLVDAARLERRRATAVKARGRQDRHPYFFGVAQARYLLRKVFRLVEEQARCAGIDPLEHQALIQIYGSETGALKVREVAERLDITPAFASSLIQTLGREPRTPPTIAITMAIIRLAMPPCAMISPARTKNGTASSGKLSRLPNIEVWIASVGTSATVRTATIEVTSRMRKIGKPRISSAAVSRRIDTMIHAVIPMTRRITAIAPQLPVPNEA